MFERTALIALRDWFSDRGQPSQFLRSPEDDPNDPLNLDGILAVGSDRWAVDHMRITWGKRTVPATEHVGRTFPLEKLAQEYRRDLWVTMPLWPGDRRAAQPYLARTEMLARTALTTTVDHFDQDGFTTIQTREPRDPERPAFQLSVYPSRNVFLGTQVREAIEEALTHKLTAQLPPAKRVGYRVGILLDQMEFEQSKQSSIWMPRPPTIAGAVNEVAALYPQILDAIWLRGPTGEVRELTT